MAQPLYGAPSESAIKRRRRLSEALLSQATDASPKGHWLQAAAQVLNGYQAGREGRIADKEEGQRSQALAEALGGTRTPEDIETAGVGYGAPEFFDIANSRRSAATRLADGNSSKYGLQPFYAQDADGNLVPYQLNSSGGMAPLSLPDGQRPAPPVSFQNTGTAINPMNTRTGQPVGQPMPIDNAGKASATEVGQQQGSAKAGLPTAEANLQNTLSVIDQLLVHPGLDSGVGTIQGQVPDAVAGFMSSDVADFRTRLNQLKGGSFLQAYETLKGGGPIAIVEGQKAEQAVARMNAATSEEDFKQALIDYRGSIERGMAAIRQRAGVVPPQQPNAAVAPPPPPDQLQPGMVVDGMIFMGGNPGDPKSWEAQ